jgi:hypothetical protein
MKPLNQATLAGIIPADKNIDRAKVDWPGCHLLPDNEKIGSSGRTRTYNPSVNDICQR